MEKLMIIDGNSIINRAFYAIRMLNTKDKTPTNALMGFLNIYYKNLENIKPDYVCVAFDMRAPTFRHKMYDLYKAQRKGMPEELAVQMPLLKEILSAMNVFMIEKEGYEADDIIGTVSKMCKENEIECDIITGDKDDLQLAGENTKIYLTVSSKGSSDTVVYTDKEVLERYGVTPKQFIDVKALMGDASDNIPGVSGIGEKTAMSLIMQNQSIENIYDNLEGCGAKGKTLEKLAAGREDAFLSKTLATIDTNAPVDFSFERSKMRDINKEELYEILDRLELKSIIKKLSLEPNEDKKNQSADLFEGLKINIADSEDAMRALAGKIKKEKEVFYKFYTDGAHLSGAAFITKDLNASYIPVSLFLSEEDIVLCFKDVFESADVLKNGSNVKDDIVFLNSYNIKYEALDFDCAIGAYILNPSESKYTTSRILYNVLNEEFTDDEEFFGKGKSKSAICDIDDGKAAEFACREVFLIKKLKEPIIKGLEKNNQTRLFYDIEMPLITTLAYMQIYGMMVDKEKLLDFQKQLEKRNEELCRNIYDIVGYEFNINSTKQLGEALFDKLGLRVIKKTKTGYSTDSDVLEKLKYDHEIIEYIIEYRLVNKLKSTYVDGLLALINPKTKRIHSCFNQTVTVTGRISSTEPNMQNIPVRYSLGREIRKMFVPGEGYSYVDADYSQIELRILAHIADDKEMIAAFENDVDIHAVTASQVMGVDLKDVTEQMRSAAKAVNFGIVYGIGEFSLAQDLKISISDAKKYIEGYLQHYKGVREYMEKIKETAEKQGYVETLFARRRYIPELKSPNKNIRSFGQRVALNTPVQGSAADIIKLAMVKVFKRLKDEKLSAKLVLQVHDELIVEAPDSEVEKVKKILQQEMENAVCLKVRLKAEAKAGKSWYEAK